MFNIVPFDNDDEFGFYTGNKYILTTEDGISVAHFNADDNTFYLTDGSFSPKMELEWVIEKNKLGPYDLDNNDELFDAFVDCVYQELIAKKNFIERCMKDIEGGRNG